MNGLDDKVRERNQKFRWLGLGVAVLALVVAARWFVFGGERPDSKPDTSASSSDSDTPPPSTEQSESLHKFCEKRLSEAPNDKVTVRGKKVTINPDSMEFEFEIAHESEKYAAIDIRFAMKFLRDDKDVTAELGDTFADDWSEPLASVLPNAARQVGDRDLKTPAGWSDKNIELNVEILGIGYWCEPKDKYTKGAG